MCERFQNGDKRFQIGNIFTMKGKLQEAQEWQGSPEWTLGVVDLAGEALSSLDTCHHPDVSQILTTTDCMCDTCIIRTDFSWTCYI